MGSVTCRPQANGSKQQWQDQYPSGYDHYQKVDEAVPNDSTDYIIATGTSKIYDTFEFSVSPVAGTRIDKVTVYSRMTPAGAGNLAYLATALYHPDHGTVIPGSWNYRTAVSWETFSTEYVANPWTSEPWTWDDLTDLEFGAGFYAGNASHAGRCTQTYIVVTYSPIPVCGGAQIIGLSAW